MQKDIRLKIQYSGTDDSFSFFQLIMLHVFITIINGIQYSILEIIILLILIFNLKQHWTAARKKDI
jgi:hypothetical protein